MAEQGSGGAADRAQPDDPFEGLVLDESFVERVLIHERTLPMSPPPDRSGGVGTGPTGPTPPTSPRPPRPPVGDSMRRYAALLVLGAMALIVVGFGAYGHGPLGSVGWLRQLGGTDTSASADGDGDATVDSLDTTTSTADPEFLDEVGTCFDGPSESDRGPAAPCDQGHTMEITGTVDLSAVKAYPAPDGWAAAIGNGCTKLATLVYGDVLPPDVHGEWLTIAPRSWAAGRRTVECTLVQRGADGLFITQTIPLRR